MTHQDKSKSELIAELEKTKAELRRLEEQLANKPADGHAGPPKAAPAEKAAPVDKRMTASEGAQPLHAERGMVEETKHRFYNLLQDLTQVAVQGYRMDGTTVFWNKAAEHLYGYTAEEAIGKNLLDLIIPDELRSRVQEEISLMARSGVPIPSGELRLQRKDGAFVHVFSSHTLLSTPGTEPEMYCVDVDLSERIRFEQELMKARDKAEESDRLKSAFLANVSHEIRTPMNGILGFAELLKEPNLTGDQQKEYLQIIEKSSARMLNIINHIVDISNIEAGLVNAEMTETNILAELEALQATCMPKVQEKGLHCSVHCNLPDDVIIIRTDREKLRAILNHLTENAIKYTDHGEIRLGCHKKDEFIEFFVKDTGIGIPNDRQKAVFERFVQADIADKEARQGAGLGLAIAQAYVILLGGKIWLESKDGQGTTFYFTLPC